METQHTVHSTHFLDSQNLPSHHAISDDWTCTHWLLNIADSHWMTGEDSQIHHEIRVAEGLDDWGGVICRGLSLVFSLCRLLWDSFDWAVSPVVSDFQPTPQALHISFIRIQWRRSCEIQPKQAGTPHSLQFAAVALSVSVCCSLLFVALTLSHCSLCTVDSTLLFMLPRSALVAPFLIMLLCCYARLSALLSALLAPFPILLFSCCNSHAPFLTQPHLKVSRCTTAIQNIFSIFSETNNPRTVHPWKRCDTDSIFDDHSD
jgi:hypothetical protein